MTVGKSTAHGDRIRLPIQLDTEALEREVRALELGQFIHYSVIPLTSPSPKAGSAVTDYADGSWADWSPTPWLAACPTIERLVGEIGRRTTVTLVRLLRLAPGAVVDVHTDPTLGLEQERSVIRLTVPIITNEHARLHLNDSAVPMRPGECWYLRFSDPHRVVNDGATERVHLSIDVIPNRWVRSWLDGSGRGPSGFPGCDRRPR